MVLHTLLRQRLRPHQEAAAAADRAVLRGAPAQGAPDGIGKWRLCRTPSEPRLSHAHQQRLVRSLETDVTYYPSSLSTFTPTTSRVARIRLTSGTSFIDPKSVKIAFPGQKQRRRPGPVPGLAGAQLLREARPPLCQRTALRRCLGVRSVLLPVQLVEATGVVR